MLKKLFKKTLLFIVTWGIYVLLFGDGYVFWMEFQKNHQDELSRRLKTHTHWVMNKFPVYFASGNKFGRINLDGSDLKVFIPRLFMCRNLSFLPMGATPLLLPLEICWCMIRSWIRSSRCRAWEASSKNKRRKD